MKRYITLFSTAVLLLAACSKPLEAMPSIQSKTVSVNVHGVNYTGDPFRYVVIEANNPSNRAGGEHIGPFSGGGIMCCFKLPKQWKPGLQVNIQATYWLKEDAKGNLPEVTKVHTVEVPRYPDGKVGELWVLRTAEGDVELVVSDVEPGHAQWPGKVKGWPLPSVAYQREQWEIYREQAEDYVRTYQSLLVELNSNRNVDLSEDWTLDQTHNAEAIKAFSGPTDARYIEYKRQQYLEGLNRSKERLDQILKSKP